MNTTKLETLTLNNVREMFESDNKKRPSNKTSNSAILTLIDIINDNSKRITCERTKGGTILNRGSVVECLIKIIMKDQQSAKKYGAKRSDMIVNGVHYEIKYSSSKGYASYSKPITDKLIFVNQYGVYLTDGSNLVMDKCGKHIKDIRMNNSVETLLTF